MATKRLILITLVVSVPILLAEGPLFRHKDPAVNQEFENVYQDIRAARILSYKGSGSPEGVVTAPIGSLYLNTDGGAGTTLYVKESGTGNTGWVGK
jgi:hypothetical protein